MKKTKRLSLLILSFLCACHPGPISHNEQQGINEILRLYGGECKYSAVKTVSSDRSQMTFKIELSKSSAIDGQSNMSDVASSNVAYTFFENLGNERGGYQNIEVKLLFSSGEHHTYSYSTGVLALFERKMKVVDNVIKQIKEKNFDSLKLLLTDTSDIKYDKNILVANLRKVDSIRGGTVGFQLLGFKYDKPYNVERPLFHIVGLLQSPGDNGIFSIYTNVSPTSDKVLVVNYKLNP